MKKLISFGSIEQFPQVVKNFSMNYRYVETVDGTAVYSNAALPTINVEFSEKIHGTQAAVCYNNKDGIWAQSKNNIITIEKDNAGFAYFVENRKEAFIDIINILAIYHDIDLNTNTMALFGEFAGGNIQKNSALSGVDKTFVIFQHFKVTPINEDPSFWLETKLINNHSENIYNINEFQKYNLEIDFENPKFSQNKLIEIVESIEMNSPVGKHFNKENNIAEGIVGTFMFNGVLFRFKIKGEKHSISKVKTLSPVDDIKEQNKIDCATKITPAWRLEQMFDLANDTINSGVPDIKNIGSFIKMVQQDIIKEELDTLAEFNLEPKDIFSIVSKISSKWYKDNLI